MVSKNNQQWKQQQEARRVPHYGLRKLSVGVASVLLGTVFYLQNGAAYADVNPAVNAGNDSVKVVNKDSGTSGAIGTSSMSTSVGLASSVSSAGGTTNSIDVSKASGSPDEGATKHANNTAWAFSESGSAALTSQVDASADNPNVSVLHQQTSFVGNPGSKQLSDNLSLSVNQKLNVNIPSLLASKVALISSNNAVNGGFDEATWGTLDVNAWKGSVQGDYFQLTDYTGDANHVIVPNEADFVKAGISTFGKQVGVTSSLMHTIFRDKTTAQDATVAFSKTDNKMVKAINANWFRTWDRVVEYVSGFYISPKGKLTKFDGSNLDVSNVTDMSDMFYNNQISDLNSLANWKVDNVTDMSDMFYNNQISDLNSLANWKTDNVTNMSEMFKQNQISDLSPLANWRVDNVTDMGEMFEQNQISDLSPLANWRVDNVTDMGGMFEQNQISDLSPLANWRVDNVTDMSEMFEQNQITDLSPLANWKVDNVHRMGLMFANNQISDLSPLTNWNVNNVGEMLGMFGNNQISNLSPLANWKVDNVDEMGEMFEQNQISDLSPLANWRVDNVTDMSSMFEQNQIKDISPLANWNVNSVNYMYRMFDNNLSVITQAKRVINFVYPASYTGKKQDPVTQTVDLPQKVSITLTTKNRKPSNNILDWVTKTETPETPAPVYFQDYTVPEIKGLLEPDKTVIVGQPADITKPINVTVTYKLVESNTNDAFALDSKNGLHEHANVNDNGGYETDFWGKLDVSKFTTVKNGDNLEITGYTGDAAKVIIPNIADFELNNLDQGAKQVTISSGVMRKLAKNATRIGLSKTNNQKVVAGDANWSNAFGGMTISPQLGVNGGMWVYNPNLTVMDLYNLDTTNITDISSMFNGGHDLKVVGDLSQWNTANVTNMNQMFRQASKLTNTGDLDDWNVSNVNNMSNMLRNASALTNIGDLSKWDVSKVTDMSWMFYQASGLTDIGDLNNWNTSNVTDMSNMFDGASNLTNIGDLSKWNVSKVTDMRWMFYQASALTNIGDLDNWDTSKVTDMSYMFSDASKLTNVGDLSKWKTSNVTNMTSMFNYASALTNIGDLDNWDTSKVTDMSWMFYQASALTNIGDLDNWDTSKVTDMSYMFSSASKLTNVGDLNNWNTSNVTDMSNMFDGASNLTNIGDLSKWNVSKVTDMSWMFYQASALTNIGDLDNWDTSKVTDMSYMFSSASKLTNVGDLSKWDVSKVTNMRSMFRYAFDLVSIGDLSKWNTSKVIDMNAMFYYMPALKQLNISNWDLTKLANKDAFQFFVNFDPNLVVIANNVKLPTWYQNELSNSNDFWHHHLAVITNSEFLLKASGSVDDVTVDDASVKRSVFYDSKGSDDAVAILKQTNQAYIKQYQNEHPGYILTLAADVDQTDPIALANAKFVSAPLDVQFKLAYYDLTGKLVDSTTSTHKVGETVAIAPVAPANYVLANGQLRMNYSMHWGLNEADFLVEPKLTMTTETKTVSRMIKVQTPDGQANNVVQAVTFVRNSYLNQVTKQTTYSPWSFGGQYQFSGYQPKPVDGYTADVVPAVIVTPDSSDTIINLAYHKQVADYSVVYQLANGTVVKNVSVTPEHDGTIHLTAPQGYRLLTTVSDVQVGSGSQKLAVLVAPVEQTYTAHDDLPSGVTEPLIKMVTRTVKITMPNGHVRTVNQQVKFERTATVKADGTVSYGNWQAIGRAQFNQVFVPKRRGYHLVITDASGKALTGVDKIDNVTAAMNDEVVIVKYVKD